jgi:aromatic-L-amino-acid decarboxylase
VIRSYGVEGIRSLVRRHVRLADEFATWIDADKRFELFAPHPFSLVCFSHIEGNEATKRLSTALNATGKVAVTPSVIDDRSFIRVSIGQTNTEKVHVKRLQALIDEMA